jgi:hypothetical protein
MNFLCKLTVVLTALFSAADAFAQGYDPSIAPLSQFGAPNGSASNYGDSSYPTSSFYVGAPSGSASNYGDSSYPTGSLYGYESQSAYQTSTRQNAARAALSDMVGFQINAPFAPRISIDGIFGNRMGIDSNSTSVSAFLPWHIDPGTNLFYGVLRGTSTDLGDLSANFGIGHRYYFEELNRIFGINGWYDIDDTHNQSYRRAGLQLESIGRYLEVRGGADIVLETNRLTLNQGFTGDAPLFQGNNVAFNFLNRSESAYDKGYIEAGGPMPFLGRYGVNAYAGAYYLWHDDSEEALGYRIRTSAALTRDVQVGMNFTNDDIFGVNTSVNVSIAFPTGGLKQMFRSPRTIIRGQSPNSPETNQVLALRQGLVSSLMSSDVMRDHRTPVSIETVITPVVAIDPLSGQPVCIVHVDPNLMATGNGSFETPFRNLEGARLANDGSCRIIRVVPRNDGTGTNLVVMSAFQLFTNQRLLSSSVQHDFATTRGVFALPGFTGGSLPLVTNSQVAADAVINMVDNTEVSGFNIDGSGRHIGIRGNINGFDINRNTIQNSTNGIQLANAQGIGLIDQNTITGSTLDGVNITVTGGNALNLTLSNNRILSSGDDGADITANASPLVAVFTQNVIGGSGSNGLELTSTGNSNVTATLTNNSIGDSFGTTGNTVDGFFFTADSGLASIIIGGPNAADGNVFVGNGGDGVNFNLTGNAVATLLAQNNTTIASVTQVGLNFTGTSFGDIPSGFPPDTMGSVGPNHIVELVNSAYAIYNKTTGALISRISDEQFWINSGVAIANSDTFDPRIIYDPQSGRWFATAIDRQLGTNANTIYLAVSKTSDPTAGFDAFLIPVMGAASQFNDFDTLGLDADAIYITTQNFLTAGTNTSLYVIPKADLLAATPSIANLTRIENQTTGTLPFRTQVAVDFGPSDGRAALLRASDSGGATLERLNVSGGSGPGATLSGVTVIPVAPYAAPVNADQPGAKTNINTFTAGFGANVVQVGNSLWAVQSITDPTTGNVSIRYYEIDETTNAVLQTGTISDPNLDFYFPSIAVNQAGNVVIGYSGSSDTQFVSTYASSGRTQGGVTVFNAPVLLKAGVSDYERIDGFGRNRWGDYSATVVDPIDPTVFWTFQEFVDGTDSYATQISQLMVGAGGNTGDGFNINVGGTSVLTSAIIDRNILKDNGGAGLRIVANGSGRITSAVISNNIATRNGTGAFLTSTAGGVINAMVGSNQFDMNTATNTGFHTLATGTGSVVNLNSFTNNTASNNGNGNGVRLEALLGGMVNVANFTGNTVNFNGLNGLFVRSNGVGSLVNGAIGINGQGLNTFNSNVGFGINFDASAGGSIFGPAGVGNFTVVNNAIGTTGAGNGMGGINAIADATSPALSTLNLTIGGTTTGDANTIVANTDAGIAYSLRNNSTGALVIRSNTITNTVDNAATTTLLGQGIFIEVAGTSTLNNSVFDANTITDNAASGIQGLIRESGMVTNLVVGNTDGDNDNGNIITGNAGDGINWLRRDFGRVINMDIIDNTLTNNVNGLNLTAQNADLLDTYDVDNNIITMNTANGVRLRVDADADLSIDMNNNLISMNAADGIDTTESLNTPSDSRSITGTWINNTITSNAGHGIQLSAATTNLIVGTAGNGNVISMNTLDGVEINGAGSVTFTENMINMNTLDGVEINGAGSATFTENMINNNGTGGFDFNPATTNLLTLNSNIFRSNTGVGVALAGTGPNSVSVIMNSNTIELNTGDGLEIIGSGTTGGLSLVSNNDIFTRNLGRGVDILNQSNADSVLSFNNATVTANELEGFYVVNTASATQNQTDLATVALAADGAVTATPTLNLTVSNSLINGNGNSSTFESTGLILRIGSSDGGQSFTDPGGFASDGRGGVIATIINNIFGGNFGEDVIFDGFTSTVDPATTGGAWTDQNTNPRVPGNDLFTPAGYQSDPLARLDLIFTGNTGDSVDVTRSGASYNNAEAIFKSRTTAQDNGTDAGGFFPPADDPGPFTSATRARNAQRLAAREVNAFGDFTPPALTIGASDSFLFPGVSGFSTFRRSAGSTTAGFTTVDLFTDSIGLGIVFGELPFEWDVFVP